MAAMASQGNREADDLEDIGGSAAAQAATQVGRVLRGMEERVHDDLPSIEFVDDDKWKSSHHRAPETIIDRGKAVRAPADRREKGLNRKAEGLAEPDLPFFVPPVGRRNVGLCRGREPQFPHALARASVITSSQV